MAKNKKRLFFGMRAEGILDMPLTGRVIAPTSRHLTLAFLGDVDDTILEQSFHEMPIFPTPLALPGWSSDLLFLPQKHPHVASLQIETLQKEMLFTFQENLVLWLRNLGYAIDKRSFLPHVTVARSPFDEKALKGWFQKRFLILKDVVLFESVGNLTYVPLKIETLTLPFEEVEHTADLAFIVRGTDLQNLYQNALSAIAMTSLSFFDYYQKEANPSSLDEIIELLNEAVCKFDCAFGTSFKAVSYHGELITKPHYLEWEMIIDV